ncbi:anti-anti-sigma factor [Prosthecochloris sp. ZM]|uniref:STAS domain-containing protein n=1 Tax=Prosthecochloris sp. ZM TaxID=2283143 RepID=UPI000DF79F03|nr:STAS domain-containing protein [Prosthecochloris sp. ZM]RDD30380.1 anti-anti-sigma factor [Prosthecochloris sp. ZM]
MTITETTHSNIHLVALKGALDASTAATLAKNSVLSGNLPTVIDLSGIDFLDSSGLGALVGIARKKRAANSDTLLACLNTNVRKVFEITHAYRLFDIYDDPYTAAEELSKKISAL